MPSHSETRALLARRPKGTGAGAFGHVDTDAPSRAQLADVLEKLASVVGSRKEVPFHPDDLAEPDEVLVDQLSGFDQHFQSGAPWSLERAVDEIRRSGLPNVLTASGIVDGDWTFYAIRSRFAGKDVVAIRAKSPSWGLKAGPRILTKVTGQELKLVKEPLIAFDRTADAVVIGQKVYVLNPRRLEALLIDADVVKARSAATASSFAQKIGASLPQPTIDMVDSACSKNANVARRVERLIRDGDLSKVNAAGVRAALPSAGLGKNTLGASGPLRAMTIQHATVLIDIAADLYYQPRFTASPRRVAAYRKVS